MDIINKKALGERDVCTTFITPALSHAGWDHQHQIREEVNVTRDYYSGDIGKAPCYYQLNAINRTVEAIANGQNRVEASATRDALKQELIASLGGRK